MTEVKKSIQALDDDVLDTITGGKTVVISKPVGFCEKCGRPLRENSKYMFIEIGGKKHYYCDGHEPRGAKAPGKSC